MHSEIFSCYKRLFARAYISPHTAAAVDVDDIARCGRSHALRTDASIRVFAYFMKNTSTLFMLYVVVYACLYESFKTTASICCHWTAFGFRFRHV